MDQYQINIFICKFFINLFEFRKKTGKFVPKHSTTEGNLKTTMKIVNMKYEIKVFYMNQRIYHKVFAPQEAYDMFMSTGKKLVRNEKFKDIWTDYEMKNLLNEVI